MCLSVSPDQLTQPGLFSFSIEVPYVYIGPHKGGERFSLSLRLLQVTYTPLSKVEPPQVLPPPGPEKDTQTQPGQRVPVLTDLTMPPPPPPTQTNNPYVPQTPTPGFMTMPPVFTR